MCGRSSLSIRNCAINCGRISKCSPKAVRTSRAKSASIRCPSADRFGWPICSSSRCGRPAIGSTWATREPDSGLGADRQSDGRVVEQRRGVAAVGCAGLVRDESLRSAVHESHRRWVYRARRSRRRASTKQPDPDDAPTVVARGAAAQPVPTPGAAGQVRAAEEGPGLVVYQGGGVAGGRVGGAVDPSASQAQPPSWICNRR